MTTVAGFLFASGRHIAFWTLAATTVGTMAIIASSCVINNYLDREIDKKMKRTKKRALASGAVSSANALLLAGILGSFGLFVLATRVNVLTAGLGLFGMFAYLVPYSIFKRRSSLGTLVGSISGAIPPVAGYTAVTNHIDSSAWLLFIILAIWQMPHFYAIGLFRRKEYHAAGLPILPVTHSQETTKRHILWYIIAFLPATVSLAVFGEAGVAYVVVMLALSIGWLRLAITGLGRQDTVAWARSLFGYSLIVLLAFSGMLSVNAWLP